MSRSWLVIACALVSGCNAMTGIDDYRVGDAQFAEDAAQEFDAIQDADALDVRPDVDATPEAPGDDGPSIERRRIFVTSATFTANLGGLAGADDKCQSAADVAKLGGKYRAWLSTAPLSVAARLPHAAFDYILVDGVTLVGHGYAGLTSGALLHAIDQTEQGKPAPVLSSPCSPGGAGAWTDTSSNGSEKGYDCGAWTYDSATIVGWTGSPTASDATWTASCGIKCSERASLYCVEQ